MKSCITRRYAKEALQERYLGPGGRNKGGYLLLRLISNEVNKKLQQFIKMVIGAGLITWLIFKLDWRVVVTELVTINIWYLSLFIACQLVAMWFSVKKWQRIAAHQNIPFPLGEGYKAYLTGTFINNFFPSTIGGDIYRSLWLARRGGEKVAAFSTVIFDRVVGLFVTLLMALGSGFFVWWQLGNLPHFLQVSYLAALGATLVFIGIAFFLPANALKKITSEKIKNVAEIAFHYRNTKVWVEAGFWTALFILTGLGVSNYILFLALGYALPLLPFLGLICLMALYVSIPLSINNIGIKEWAYGVLFVLLGVSFEAAIAVALLSRLLQTLLSLLALPAYLLEKREANFLVPVHTDTPSQSGRDAH